MSMFAWVQVHGLGKKPLGHLALHNLILSIHIADTSG